MKKEITIKVEKKNFFINVVQQTSKLKKICNKESQYTSDFNGNNITFFSKLFHPMLHKRFFFFKPMQWQ